MVAHEWGGGRTVDAGGESVKRVLPRKAFHLASIGSMAAVAALLPRFTALTVLSVILLGIFLVFLGLRFRPRSEDKEFQEEVGRKDKAFPLQGTVMALVGACGALLLFGSTFAAAGLVILALGDGLSTLYALRFGRFEFPWTDRYADAWLFGVLVAAAVASFLVPWWMALLASAIAQLPDALGLDMTPVWLDDNLVIPLVAGAVLAGVGFSLG